ncbi:MAG: recombination mediator RecR [Patescibacteria group bacterium]|jgi:recombination protein RecR|nr:recombination mediator RecR [Patescibacteria group bacterium]
MAYSQEIQNLIDKFSLFPGIGPKTAQRFVFYLLRINQGDLDDFIDDLEKIKSISFCENCFNFSSQKICPICQDPKRDKSIITVIAEPQDLIAVEKIGEYRGVYHVLGGLIDTVQNVGPREIKIKELLGRLKNFTVNEVIFALNSTIEGEGTMLYLVNLIKKDPQLNKIKLTKIARGLPLGGEIEYADEITLSEALRGRKII